MERPGSAQFTKAQIDAKRVELSARTGREASTEDALAQLKAEAFAQVRAFYARNVLE